MAEFFALHHVSGVFMKWNHLLISQADCHPCAVEQGFVCGDGQSKPVLCRNHRGFDDMGWLYVAHKAGQT